MTTGSDAALALPPGFVVRPAELTDVDVAFEISVAHHFASGGAVPPTRAEVEADLAYPKLDRQRDTWLVLDPDGRAVFYGFAWCERPLRVYLDYYAHPVLDEGDHELAVAVTSAMVRAGIARAHAAAGEANLEDALVETGMVRGDPLLSEVFGAAGFTHERSWWRMSADAEAIRATDAVVPAGLRIAKVDPDVEADRRLAWELEEETFAEHYGNVPATFETFSDEYRHAAGYDRTAWWVAYDDATGEPAGVLIGDDGRAADGDGHVDTLGVRKAFRGRGVASSLLRTAFAEYAARDRTSVSLEVDTKNQTGAVALYERVGMRPVDVYDTWELSLRR